MFGDLYYAGIIDAKTDRPPRELATQAWHVLGPEITAKHGLNCWGALEFGHACSL